MVSETIYSGSARMYNAVPAAAAAWQALLERVFRDAGVAIQLIEHKFPDPIADLWAKPELGCAFMCGWPYVRAGGRMQAIAAPVPSPERYGNQPRYCSEFLVREESGWTTLEETFGHRFGWMSVDSQSGFNAPRYHLSRFVSADRPKLYAEVTGPLGAPMKALQALQAAVVDVTALDSFFLDLVRHHEPARLAGVRTVATTAWTPIPLLVAAPCVELTIINGLRHHFLGLHERRECAALLAETLVARFVAPRLPDYQVLETMAAEAEAKGYAEIR